MFLGDVSEVRQAEIRAAIEDVMSFYDDRYGIVLPEFTLYVSPSLDSVASRFNELTGRGSIFDAGWEGGLATYTPEHGLLGFIAGRQVSDGDVQLRGTLAHEYYHLIQHDMLKSAGLSGTAPAWLIEGTAAYNESLYGEHYTGAPVDRPQRLLALRGAGSFRDITESFGFGGYEIASLAVDWLDARSGDQDASLDYWRLLADTTDWSEAFEAAFGISPDDFFAAFEAHRGELEAGSPRISGVVLDQNGNTLDGVNIMASAFVGNAGPSSSDVTAADGSFEILVPDGEYLIQLGRVVPAAPGTPYRSIFFGLAYNTRTGYANSCGPHTAIEAGTTGLVIRVLQELLTRVDDPPCNEGVPGHYVIESTVIGPDGETITRDPAKLDGVRINPTPLRVARSSGIISPTGVSRVAVPPGTYVLQIRDQVFGREDRPVGWYGGETGFTADRAQATVVEVEGAGITIEIHLPADPAGLPTIE